MKTLYEAANAVEAHMLVDLLRQEGVDALIHGEALQGAVGGVPAAGLIRLVVDEDDYARGRAVVERWERTQVVDATPAKPRSRSRGGRLFLLGLLVGVAATYALFRTPVTVDGVDYNRDGVLDEKWTYAPSGTVLKNEIDRNLDGKVDYVAHFDRHGLIESADSDEDFDGVFETHARFRDGNIEYSESDTDGDGAPDLRSHYANGVLQSTEYINPSSGLPLRVEHFRLGKLITAEVDTDQDGVLDTRVHYSAIGEVTSTDRIEK
jgi:hypothetical protein